jgi:plasmid stability protein
MTMPRSITIHDVDDTTATWLDKEAGRRGVNVETVARQLLHRALVWERRRAQLPAYHWSEDEATAPLHAIADFEQVDPSLWR